jgi:hypothetical protein
MRVGAANIDISPESPVDLSGFAARTQPMTGQHDPIHAKALYLGHGGRKLLWLHCDVLALSRDFVREFREFAATELNVPNVLLSSTHTHAAPATVNLTGCGRIDDGYLRSLQSRAQTAARQALASTTDATQVFVQTEHRLAIDRRGKASAHVDSTLSALGWKRSNGEFIAALLNYPMHPVSLGHVNRQISADWCGGADREITSALPGAPITFVTNGACGNLNPPARPVSFEQAHQYGRSVACAIAAQLAAAKPSREALNIANEYASLPLEAMPSVEIDSHVAARLNECEDTEWAKPFRDALSTWRETQQTLLASGQGTSIDIEIFAVDVGPVIIAAISGELFSRFTAMLRERIARPVFVVGYANAVFGYIPTAEAYDEGGYEVDQAHFFYNSFRPQKGGLEMLVDRAASIINGNLLLQ